MMLGATSFLISKIFVTKFFDELSNNDFFPEALQIKTGYFYSPYLGVINTAV